MLSFTRKTLYMFYMCSEADCTCQFNKNIPPK